LAPPDLCAPAGRQTPYVSWHTPNRTDGCEDCLCVDLYTGCEPRQDDGSGRCINGECADRLLQRAARRARPLARPVWRRCARRGAAGQIRFETSRAFAPTGRRLSAKAPEGVADIHANDCCSENDDDDLHSAAPTIDVPAIAISEPLMFQGDVVAWLTPTRDRRKAKPRREPRLRGGVKEVSLGIVKDGVSIFSNRKNFLGPYRYTSHTPGSRHASTPG
jgi:hypothetical protein